MILGIDPGKTGAIALVDPVIGEVYGVEDMPAVLELAVFLLQYNPTDLQAIVEKVRALPPAQGRRRAGTQSSFNFGRSYGEVIGLCAGLDIPLDYIDPITWKRRAGLIGEDKAASMDLARRLYPEAKRWLTRKKDHGRAEAILIATYGII